MIILYTIRQTDSQIGAAGVVSLLREPAVHGVEGVEGVGVEADGGVGGFAVHDVDDFLEEEEVVGVGADAGADEHDVLSLPELGPHLRLRRRTRVREARRRDVPGVVQLLDDGRETCASLSVDLFNKRTSPFFSFSGVNSGHFAKFTCSGARPTNSTFFGADDDAQRRNAPRNDLPTSIFNFCHTLTSTVLRKRTVPSGRPRTFFEERAAARLTLRGAAVSLLWLPPRTRSKADSAMQVQAHSSKRISCPFPRGDVFIQLATR